MKAKEPQTKKNVLKYYESIRVPGLKKGSELTDKAINLISMSWKYIEWAKINLKLTSK